MKGVILAGGLGKRLYPLTKITNKHLLPVYEKPMIFYPLQTLINAGIDDILIVTGGNHAGDFLRLLGNGKEFGLKHLNYTYQEGEGGIEILLKEVPDPERFGVAEIVDGKIVGIEEKPKVPKSRDAVIGIYMYDARVFDIIRTLRPSDRGELEITDVSNAYIREGKMTYDFLEGWWSDAGTFDSLLRAGNLVAQGGANNRNL